MNPTAQALLHFLQTWWVELVCAVVIVAIVPLIAGYVVLVERKLMADMQARLGPMRVGPHGLLQPIADAVKLLIKEDLVPRDADGLIFWFAPVITMVAALTAMGALYFGPAFRVAQDINIGILFVIGVSSLGFLGIILGGWASNSHYSIIGAIRSTAQLVSYEAAGGIAIVSALLLAGTLRIPDIVAAQFDSHVWFIFLAPVGFFIFMVASIAETNRAPFDLPEAESELVAGYMTEYSGFRWSLYFLGEYANMIVVASVATTLFLGGWLRPFPNIHWLRWLDLLPALFLGFVGVYCIYRAGKQPVKIQTGFMWAVALACFGLAAVFIAPWIIAPLRFALPGLNGAFWFLFKVSAYIYVFMWLRFTLPRYRFDQLMHLGWYILIPLAIINVFSVGLALLLESEFGLNRWFTMIVTTAFTLAISLFLVRMHDKRTAAASSAAAVPSDSYAG
ncbi:MAG TPA: complex I subunit 1 family protein [Candidatus Acidoferrales bacterium]|jgi:NADH-quinone oxidoreductase subunit H|nr:complex I subunit 1 family protein [Candidatus Acidoferrales bacterium]